jgi:hypothetical protein
LFYAWRGILAERDAAAAAPRSNVPTPAAASRDSDGIPVPLPPKDCRIWFGDSKKPFLRFRLGGQRFTVRLRGGFRFARQIAPLEKAAADPELRGEVSLCLRQVGDSRRAVNPHIGYYSYRDILVRKGARR